MEPKSFDQYSRLVRCINVRYDDSQRAVIQRPGAFIKGTAADAYNWHNAGWQCRETELRYLLRGDGAVLGIDE
jgi:hypothetical protein